jgi:hypothetical protein
VIANRAQALDRFFSEEIRHGLDPWIRLFFFLKILHIEIPCKQPTNHVVNALVETGIFSYTKAKFPHYYRPVNALRVND